jgi:hypothetical protein
MRPAEALSLVALLAAIGAGGAATAANSTGLYHAGVRALQDGECEAARRQFDAFFAENPGYVKPPHPFYFDVLRAVEACRATLSISGVGQDTGALPPLPEEPPPVE